MLGESEGGGEDGEVQEGRRKKDGSSALHDISGELVENCGKGASDLVKVALEETECFEMEHKRWIVNENGDGCEKK